MSLTRKFLTGMGLTAEQVDAIIEEHAATVDALKEDRDKYKADAENYKETKKEFENLKKQVEDGSADSNEWKEKYEKEHKDFEAFKKAEKDKETLSAVQNAYTKLLKDNNVAEKHIKSILGVTKFDGMKLNEDGTLADSDKLVDEIKDLWGGFITQTETAGAGVKTPPAGNGNKYSSKKEIMEIKDAGKRQEAIRNNPELFQ